jgi:hypothetical protein
MVIHFLILVKWYLIVYMSEKLIFDLHGKYQELTSSEILFYIFLLVISKSITVFITKFELF